MVTAKSLVKCTEHMINKDLTIPCGVITIELWKVNMFKSLMISINSSCHAWPRLFHHLQNENKQHYNYKLPSWCHSAVAYLESSTNSLQALPKALHKLLQVLFHVHQQWLAQLQRMEKTVEKKWRKFKILSQKYVVLVKILK